MSTRTDPIVEAATFPFEPVRLAPLYQLGLLVVAAAMVVLPLVYVALVGLLGYGVWYHATRNFFILGEGSLGTLMAYVTPLVAGGLALVFMVKPLFAARLRPPSPHTLAPDVRAPTARVRRSAVPEPGRAGTATD